MLLVVALLFVLPPVHNQVFKGWLHLRGSAETITMTFTIHDLVSSSIKDEDRAEVIALLLESLDAVVVTYQPVVMIEGVTKETQSWWSFEGLVGIGGIGFFERRSSTDLVTHERQAKILDLDLETGKVVLALKIEPILHYRPRHLTFNFQKLPALDSLIHYEVNGIPAISEDFTIDIPINMMVDGKQDFSIRNKDSEYWRQSGYFSGYDSPHASVYSYPPTDRSEVLFSLKVNQVESSKAEDLNKSEVSVKVTNTPQYSQAEFLDDDRYEAAFQDNQALDVYRLRRQWYDYANPLRGGDSGNSLAEYQEKGLLIDAANMVELNIYRTQGLSNGGSFLSFDEYWQVYRHQLMRFELVSSSYEGFSRGKCWFGAEIVRDKDGTLRRYLNQWSASYQKSSVEVDEDLWLQEAVEAAMKVANERGLTKSQGALTYGDEEDCTAKMRHVQAMLSLNEEALLARLELLKSLMIQSADNLPAL